MSVDYRARVIFGYRISEEEYNYIEEHWDEIVNKELQTWCVCETQYFFGINLAKLDLEEDCSIKVTDYPRLTYAVEIYNALKDIKCEIKGYPEMYLINCISY